MIRDSFYDLEKAGRVATFFALQFLILSFTLFHYILTYYINHSHYFLKMINKRKKNQSLSQFHCDKKQGIQKELSRVVHRKSCSENMQLIYRRTPMPKCDFNTSAWVFSCKFATYLQNTFSYEDFWRAASDDTAGIWFRTLFI